MSKQGKPCEKSEPSSSPAGLAKIDDLAAEKLLSQIYPLVDELEASGKPYAIVGGLAVMLQALSEGFTEFRATRDLDLMVEDQSLFLSLARKRNEVAAASGIDVSRSSKALESAEIAAAIARYEEENECLPPILADKGRFAIGIDSVTRLNGFDISTLQTEKIEIGGHAMTVATCAQLKTMKEKTIRLLGGDPLETSRPQDFIDIARLNQVINRRSEREAVKKALAKRDSGRNCEKEGRDYAEVLNIRSDRGHKAPKHDR